MSERRRIFAGAAAMSAAQVAEQACVFARNLILARLLGPDNMGVAATLAVTLSLLEMTSDLAADRLLLQAKDGDEAELQSAAQAVEFARGVLIAAAIVALAGPIARLFDVPDAVWAYRLLGLAPLLRGLVHLDAKRLVRSHRYQPLIMVDLGSQALAMAVAWPLARATGDYSAALWVIIAQVSGYAAISHLVAARRYSWGMTRAAWTRIVAFGWPLLVNGLLMFAIFQGDRLIVGVFYNMETLGVFSVAFALAMMPTMMAARIATPLVLPSLAKSYENPAQFERRYGLAMELATVVTSAYLCLVIGSCGAIMGGLYGEEYRVGGPYLAVLAGMQAFRIVRIVPTLGAMAMGDTRNALLANLWRLLALPGAIAAAALGAPVVWLIVAGIGGELLATVASIARLSRRQGVSIRAALPILGSGVGLAAGLASLRLQPLAVWGDWGVMSAVAGITGAVALGTAAIMPRLRGELSLAIAYRARRRPMGVDSA